jgi:hypothetical protein
MRSLLSRWCTLFRALALVILCAPTRSVFAQTASPAPTTPPQLSLTPDNEPSPGLPRPPTSERSVAAANEAALETAAAKVVNRIQDKEQILYQCLSYLQKPERLDPNSFASVEEVAAWKKTLQDVREKGDLVANLYANIGKDLETELGNAKIDPPMLARFKGAMLDGFPWDNINRKNQLVHEFIEEHGKLLAFYEKNFGTWKKGVDNKPVFDSARQSAIYQKLRNEIVGTGQKLEKEYRSISE